MKPLGYDPRPDLKRWRGTPIPPVDHPLALTSERRTIAERIWWNGPPWTILRNARRYLWSVMDFGTDEDIAYTRTDVQHDLSVLALRTAKPGQVSRGSWILFSIAYGLIANSRGFGIVDSGHTRRRSYTAPGKNPPRGFGTHATPILHGTGQEPDGDPRPFLTAAMANGCNDHGPGCGIIGVWQPRGICWSTPRTNATTTSCRVASGAPSCAASTSTTAATTPTAAPGSSTA